MAVSGGVYYFSKTRASKPRKKRERPEAVLQAAVAQYLTYALPPEYLWTCDLSGVKLTDGQAYMAKGQGMQAGNPDIRILFPTGVTRYWELKSAAGVLSPAQMVFRDACLASGRDIWALIRTSDEAEACLLRWRVPVRCALARANRYGGMA